MGSRTIDGLFILHYAELGLLELYYDFSYKYCDEILFEELELNTDLLH